MSTLLSIVTAAALAASPPCAPVPDRAPVDVAARADSGLTLRLNLPAFRLELRDAGGDVRSYMVAIGSRRYRTPVGRYHVSSVELNPWWHPPDSEWARKEKVTPPGPNNPMGRAKLNFHELYFLHGTPLEASLGSAASHGCVRMASTDALDLARRVLAFARPDVRAEEIDALEASRRTRRYALRTPVPLEIEYRTAEVRDGVLELHPDVYGRERTPLRARALEALRRAGVAEEMLDPARLDSVARAGRRGHVRIEVDALFRAPEPPPPVLEDPVGVPAAAAPAGRGGPAAGRRGG
jgi:L,D-transpeptidase catalytic domain